MSTGGTASGAELYARRHERGTRELTAEQVRSSPIAAGMARWQARHATKPIIGPDGMIVHRPDREARQHAMSLLSAEDRAEVERLDAAAAEAVAGS